MRVSAQSIQFDPVLEHTAWYEIIVSQFNLSHSHTHTLRQLLSMGSMGVGLGRTTLISSLPHSRTDHSSITSARTNPATKHQAGGFNMDLYRVDTQTLSCDLKIIRFYVAGLQLLKI